MQRCLFNNARVYRKVSLLAALTLIPLVARADRLRIESAVVDSQSGAMSSVSKGEGKLSTFFVLQKKVVYDTLRGLGVAVEQLPEDIRKSLARFHTENFEAFRAFANGLHAADEGRYAEAKRHFERAIELDPEFFLAARMQAAMPQSNVYGGLQLQNAIKEAAKNATSAATTSVDIDASRAVAAMLSGQSVVVGSHAPVAPSLNSGALSPGFTSNQPGAADVYGTRSVVGVAYATAAEPPVEVAFTGEWTAAQVRRVDGELQSVGSPASFVASRDGASLVPVGRNTLADGTVIAWGRWNHDATGGPTVLAGGNTLALQDGRPLLYMVGAATATMPTTGSASFVPAGGFLGNVSGRIDVNFVTRSVVLDQLAFDLAGKTFSQLTGQANYGANSASGFFSGNFASGGCEGCKAFAPTASAFTGNFAGRSASGLVFSNVMQTGEGTVSGLHSFSREGAR